MTTYGTVSHPRIGDVVLKESHTYTTDEILTIVEAHDSGDETVKRALELLARESRHRRVE